MTRPSSDVQRIVEETRQSFFDFIEKRKVNFPTVLARMAADPLGASIFLRPAAWLAPGHSGLRERSYFFLTLRFRELLARLPARQAVVIGAGRDYFLARRLGLDTCSSADLYLASHAILFGRRGIPVERILMRWMRMFASQRDPCYLVLPHDTSPISLLLTRIAAQCQNMRSVCIQHGLLNAGYDDDDLEGRNSRINLVYDEAQRREMLRRLPLACVEPMGFPAELPLVAAGIGVPSRVILVGTGTTDSPALLSAALDVFYRANNALQELDIPIEYRPHPAELRRGTRAGLGLALNRQGKLELLAGPRKLFVGFNSTLLYEAFLSGHMVVLLDHPLLPGYSIREFGLKLAACDVDQIAVLVRRESGRERNVVVACDDVGTRFEDALRRADTH